MCAFFFKQLLFLTFSVACAMILVGLDTPVNVARAFRSNVHFQEKYIEMRIIRDSKIPLPKRNNS